MADDDWWPMQILIKCPNQIVRQVRGTDHADLLVVPLRHARWCFWCCCRVGVNSQSIGLPLNFVAVNRRAPILHPWYKGSWNGLTSPTCSTGRGAGGARNVIALSHPAGGDPSQFRSCPLWAFSVSCLWLGRKIRFNVPCQATFKSYSSNPIRTFLPSLLLWIKRQKWCGRAMTQQTSKEAPALSGRDRKGNSQPLACCCLPTLLEDSAVGWTTITVGNF